MRTYLGMDIERNLFLECSLCKVHKYLYEFVAKPVRPKFVEQVNTLRLVEYIGNFTMEHSDCKEEVPGISIIGGGGGGKCPSCQSDLVGGDNGSGVKCSKCSWWFCY